MISIQIDSISNADVLLKVARELYTLYKEKQDGLPYRMNILSELHANENANSRILRGLLQYSSKSNFPILDSFVTYMSRKCDTYLDITIKDPIITNEENRIDLLIKEKGKYAIIIENKIWNAIDQEEQIERYVNYTLEKYNTPKNKVIVIYLTGNGFKEVSEYSLTEKAKKLLNMTKRSDGQFIKMNFKHDIVPWLESLREMDIVTNEPFLSSGLVQYIDFLKEKFELREEDNQIETQLEIRMMEKLQLNSLKEMLQTWEEVDKLQNLLYDATNRRIASMCDSKICYALEKKGYVIKEKKFSYDYFNLEIEIPEWKKAWWAMESEKDSLYYGIWKNPEKKIAQKYLSKMPEVYPRQESEGYIAWDYWENKSFDDEFWENLESHSIKFVNQIITEIERVREATKNMNL